MRGSGDKPLKFVHVLYIAIGLLSLIVVALVALLLRTAKQSKNQTIDLENARAEINRLTDELDGARKSLALRQSNPQPNAVDFAAGTSTAVELGTAVLEAGHKTLAEGAFKVLDSFESTREAGRAAQKLHDDNVDGVYAAISGINRAVGDVFRSFSTYRVTPAKPRVETSPEPTTEV
ncbi:hypothetical protein SMNI109538_15280 [Smaragdicoccus niigatensis]